VGRVVSKIELKPRKGGGRGRGITGGQATEDAGSEEGVEEKNGIVFTITGKEKLTAQKGSKGPNTGAEEGLSPIEWS